MSDMFARCSSLNKLNLSNFNTDNVYQIHCMFFECSSLKELDISSNFNTNYIIDKDQMFKGCPNELINKIKEQYKSIDV